MKRCRAFQLETGQLIECVRSVCRGKVSEQHPCMLFLVEVDGRHRREDFCGIMWGGFACLPCDVSLHDFLSSGRALSCMRITLLAFGACRSSTVIKEAYGRISPGQDSSVPPYFSNDKRNLDAYLTRFASHETRAQLRSFTWTERIPALFFS